MKIWDTKENETRFISVTKTVVYIDCPNFSHPVFADRLFSVTSL